MDNKENLVYNGDFKYGEDGWVTSSYKFEPTAVNNGSYGGLVASGTAALSMLAISKDFIPVDTSCTYSFHAEVIKYASASSYCYGCIFEYDKYLHNMSFMDVSHYTVTTLSADLNNGDTAATVANASAFYVNTKNNYHVLGICDSPAWGSNRSLHSEYIVASAVNTTTNVVPFKSAWTGGTWKAGTEVARYNAGNTYMYPYSFNQGQTNVWTERNFTITPNIWRYTTYFCKIGQSKNTNWKLGLTNFRLENTTKLQYRDNDGAPKTETTPSIKKTATALGSEVKETSTQNVRYIRDFCSGSTANAANHWCEIQAWDKYGRNVAFGSIGSAITRTGSISLISSITKSGVNNSSNANYIKTHAVTKGTPSPASTYIGLGQNTGIIIDLGQVFEIETIKIWHYWGDTRTYHNVKTEVSEDKVNWKTVFDSSVSGEYAESSAGLTIDFSETNMSITKAGIYKTTALYEI